MREFGGRGGFEPQVQFTPNHTVEMFDHIHRAQTTRAGGEQFHHAGRQIERIDVLAERLFDARTQHLDRDFLSGFRNARTVHLRDRGSGDGFAELRKERIDRLTQLFLDFRLGGGDVERGKFVLQHAQLQRHFVADHIRPCRKDLAELDIGRAQRGERTGGGRHCRIALVP